MAVQVNGDVCTYDGLNRGAVDNDFRAVIDFLRDKYRDWPTNVPNFWVVFMVDQKPIRICFQKKDLYLIGWAIGAAAPFPYFHVAGAEAAIPPNVRQVGSRQTISLSYSTGFGQSDLGHSQLLESLRTLRGYLNKWEEGRPPTDPDRRKAEGAFSVLAKTTAEMARFGAFFESFLGTWADAWPQSTAIGDMHFGWAIANWAQLSKLSEGKPATVKIGARAVTPAEATQLIGNGVAYASRR
ncbi:ribosome-inactivating family protein [Streptomyces sp. NPDC059477]|uniref:ribosome-inactivating family protein n=1 Tax=Streptomyces sp. NPDC059477 TaxID=3346847 RepID=UPI003698AA76